ncbi:MAG: RAMP superfamily CRISPR-associated protein [Armatimonadetes bacterium]|nr:RAMP superfamily CRISPR-associated protein [Armatimonadota bacterium]
MNLRQSDTIRRQIAARWIMTCDLTTTSASMIGSAPGDLVDETFIRDVDGSVVLPGSSLAGALRSALSDEAAGYGTPEADCAAELFGCVTAGGEAGRVAAHQSHLIVFDSRSAAPRAAVRDGVRLQASTGVAAEKAKYDREIALPGLVFPVRLELVCPAAEDEPRLLALVCVALDCLKQGRIALGARKSRGLGRCSAGDFRARRFDMTRREGWQAYAECNPRKPLGVREAQASPADAVEHELGLPLPAVERGRAEKVTVRCDLEVSGTLLIRSLGPGGTGADAVHFEEDGRSMVPGTSLAGALRSHARRILNTLNAHGKLGSGLTLEEVFGAEAPEAGGQPASPLASRLHVDEATIASGLRHNHTRVKIDRFTGGALDTALFTEQPQIGGNLRVVLELRRTPSLQWEAAVGLLCLLARDLCRGMVPIGGGAGVGRGIVAGTAQVCLAGEEPCRLDGAAGTLQQYVDALLGATGGGK